jgi:hypothetical protein
MEIVCFGVGLTDIRCGQNESDSEISMAELNFKDLLPSS